VTNILDLTNFFQSIIVFDSAGAILAPPGPGESEKAGGLWRAW